ncbi:class I adenylate-forming enzyme family protein [Micromonospora sp. NPDC023644]|uniref:class I adenylate-forming enzyme family protein n=1 Tax=Micromonospora sp. NPDC023644 TaxID=3154321 RepID=UPI0033CCEDC2
MGTPQLVDGDLVHSYLGRSFGPPWEYGGTIVSVLVRQVAVLGDAAFLTTVTADGATTTLSYREVDRLSRRVRAWLRRERGVTAGDVVALAPVNDVRSVVGILGVLRAGCSVLLLSPADPAARMRDQVRAAGATVLLHPPAVDPDPSLAPVALPDPSVLADPPPDDGDAPASPGADAFLIGTSGSTASSKLVAQSHYNVVANAAALRAHHRLRPGERILGCLPIHHVNGLHFTVMGPLAAGAHVMLAGQFDPFDYPRLLERFRPRIASVVPTILETLTHVWRGPRLPGDFEYFVSAAAPLTGRTAQDVHRRLGARVLQGYGLTETTNFSTTMPADASADTCRRLLLDADIPSIGTAMPGNEVRVLRADGTAAEPGEVGELCMRGHNVMSRYAGNPAATAEAFRHGWFHSQDLGFAVIGADDPRPYFVITGRTKNIAKVRGETVSLEEMERALRAVPGVRDAACVSMPHRFLGDEIVAAVVLAPDSRPDLAGALRASFAAAVVPQRILPLDAIPRTATGKIIRPALTDELIARTPGVEPVRTTT